MVTESDFNRAWLSTQVAKAGVKVMVDGGFTCIAVNTKTEIKVDEQGLYIECSHGRHYLSGQKQGDFYIGLYPT